MPVEAMINELKLMLKLTADNWPVKVVFSATLALGLLESTSSGETTFIILAILFVMLGEYIAFKMRGER